MAICQQRYLLVPAMRMPADQSKQAETTEKGEITTEGAISAPSFFWGIPHPAF
jgi:hypothetical protein